MASHIENVCKRLYVRVDGSSRRLRPTDLGIVLCRGFSRVDAALCMPEGKAGEVGDDGEKKNKAVDAGAADDDAVTKAIAAASPYLSQMGMGSFFGLTSGYALKKIGKMAAFGTGCVFMLLQGLAYNGLIEIHWGAVQDKAKAALDLDGDGKLDAKDLVELWKRYLKPMFTYHLPGAVGFPLGFVVGFKNG